MRGCFFKQARDALATCEGSRQIWKLACQVDICMAPFVNDLSDRISGVSVSPNAPQIVANNISRSLMDACSGYDAAQVPSFKARILQVIFCSFRLFQDD